MVAAIGWRGAGPWARWRPMFFGEFLSSRHLMFAGGGLLVVAFLVSGTVLLLLNGRKLSAVQLGPSFVAAFVAIAGVALVLVGAFLWLLRGAYLDAPRTVE